MDPDWLPFHPNPSKPRFRPPPGAVDAHCHVFGPGAQFPYAPERKYTPCDASKDQLYALRDFLGCERNVIVQATCHGTDNRALVDALVHSNGRARGVASVARDVSDAELRAMHAAGVRGTRFNFVRRLVDFTPREVLLEPERPAVVDPHRLEGGPAARESLVVRSEHGLTGLHEPASRDRDGEQRIRAHCRCFPLPGHCLDRGLVAGWPVARAAGVAEASGHTHHDPDIAQPPPTAGRRSQARSRG